MSRLPNFKNEVAVGYIILFLGVLGAYWVDYGHNRDAREAIVASGNAVAVEGCNRDFDNAKARIESARLSLEQLEANRRRGIVEDEDYRRTKRAYMRLIASIKVPDCRDVVNVITDEPTAYDGTPAPKYEK